LKGWQVRQGVRYPSGKSELVVHALDVNKVLSVIRRSKGAQAV
jgi:hypothetical protein